MINVINSTQTRPSSTTQDVLNELKDLWDWERIVYDETTPTNVSQLWLSDKLYISLTGSNNYIKFTHNVSGYNSTISASFSTYTLVHTDNALLVYTTSYCFIIGKTIDLDSIESNGAIINTNTNSSFVLYTDNMTSAATMTTGSFKSDSSVYTQLVPIYSHTSNERFVDIFYNFIRKSGDSGKIILNNEHYYMYNYVALKYT